jgi:cell division septum initiation protein DivIVA
MTTEAADQATEVANLARETADQATERPNPARETDGLSKKHFLILHQC